MSQNLGSLPIANAVPTRFLAPSSGIKALVIGNESGLTCSVKLEGTSTEKILYPGTVDWFDVLGSTFTGNVLVIPTLSISVGILYPSSFLSFQSIGTQDSSNASVYPLTLARQMSVGTNSPQAGISATTQLTMSGAPANYSGINIFNPVNSKIILRLYGVQVAVSDIPSAVPTCVIADILIRFDNIDNATKFASSSGFPVFAHNMATDANLSIANSIANVVQFVDQAIPANNTFYGSWMIKSTLPYDFLGPPDSIFVYPGQNFSLVVQGSPLGVIVPNSRVHMVFKWTEQ